MQYLASRAPQTSDMSHALAQGCFLDILLSCSRSKVERGGETAIYHPGESVSGFLKILGHTNTVFDNVSVALEGESQQREFSHIIAETHTGIVRLWEGSLVQAEDFWAVQHRVSVLRFEVLSPDTPDA